MRLDELLAWLVSATRSAGAELLKLILDPRERTAWPYLLSAFAVALVAGWRARARSPGAWSWSRWFGPYSLADLTLELRFVALSRLIWVFLLARWALSSSSIQTSLGQVLTRLWPQAPLGFLTQDPQLARLLSWLWLLLWVDFAVYWSHRWSHESPFLWAFHSIHHSAERMSPLTALRVHPVDELWTAGISALGAAAAALSFLLLFGPAVEPWRPYGFEALALLFMALSYNLRHSHVPLDFGRLGWVFISPKAHQVHHSVDPRDHNKNYGFLFSIWDRALGSYRAPRASESLRFGLGDEPARRGAWDLIVSPFSELLRFPNWGRGPRSEDPRG